jgi:exopolysaccharide biosynthesis WecB/TagA/CpsF family protein
MIAEAPRTWPKKYDLFGVHVSATTCQEAVEAAIRAARNRVPAVLTHLAAHGIMTVSLDADLRRRVNSFQIVAPDGQPVRWAMNLLHRLGLRDRVYGPDTMLQLCRRAAAERIPIYLYGSTPAVVRSLRDALVRRCPGLIVAGAESPPFGEVSEAERLAAVARINASGAGIVFLGLGCPKQDHFAYDHRQMIPAVQVCVGAAFDFHAGHKRMAPRWMQRHGLEWFFRLCAEPRRLWRRYLVTNTLFIVHLLLTLASRRRREAIPAATEFGSEESA